MIKKILLYIWQLPQNLLGLCILNYNKLRKGYCEKVITDDITWYRVKYLLDCGISLGDYIILDIEGFGRNTIPKTTIKHEHGHQIQSLYLGWLYLPIIGISSAIFNNLWDRVFHKKWTYKERNKWYYNRFPENWADKLGDVKRNF